MDCSGDIIVAIPVKNEETVIRACLQALHLQTQRPRQILLLLNNCTDHTWDISRKIQRNRPNIKIKTCNLPDELVSAGEARRQALDWALNVAGDGLILTTDADAVPYNSWIADNLIEIEAGADVVCGMAEINWPDSPKDLRRLKFDDMREKLLLRVLDKITALVDPCPADPWPRHQQHSGASIAMKAEFLRRVGGAPQVSAGEDRALVERLNLVDARIRHAPHITVGVSGRLIGRAAGGMAETIRRRLQQRDELLDETIEPVVDAYRRVTARARLRVVRGGQGGADRLAQYLLLSPASLSRALHAPFFGAAWSAIQSESSILQRRRVPFADLTRETQQAFFLLKQLIERPQFGSAFSKVGA